MKLFFLPVWCHRDLKIDSFEILAVIQFLYDSLCETSKSLEYLEKWNLLLQKQELLLSISTSAMSDS